MGPLPTPRAVPLSGCRLLRHHPDSVHKLPRLRPVSLQTKPKVADQGVGHSLLDSSWTSRWLHSCSWTTRRGHRPAGLRLRAPPWTPRLRPRPPCWDVASRWPEPRTASQCSATILFHLHGKCCRRWSVSRAAPGIVPCLSPHGDELERRLERASWARVPRSTEPCRASRAAFCFCPVTAPCPLDLSTNNTAQDKIWKTGSHFSSLPDVSRTFCLKASPEKRSYSLVARMIKRQKQNPETAGGLFSSTVTGRRSERLVAGCGGGGGPRVCSQRSG